MHKSLRKPAWENSQQALNVNSVNPFKPSGISYSYQLEQSISVLRDVG